MHVKQLFNNAYKFAFENKMFNIWISNLHVLWSVLTNALANNSIAWYAIFYFCEYLFFNSILLSLSVHEFVVDIQNHIAYNQWIRPS